MDPTESFWEAWERILESRDPDPLEILDLRVEALGLLAPGTGAGAAHRIRRRHEVRVDRVARLVGVMRADRVRHDFALAEPARDVGADHRVAAFDLTPVLAMDEDPITFAANGVVSRMAAIVAPMARYCLAAR